MGTCRSTNKKSYDNTIDDHDESFTNSLGSTFIFKRVKAGEAWQDVIVAEYSGRPNTAEEYYENVRKLLTFYNARLLFENERKGIYPYFVNKHCDYYNIKLNNANKYINKGSKTTSNYCELVENNKYIIFKIKEIKISKYTGTVYNFECDTHTYMCRNILTHNCDPLT